MANYLQLSLETIFHLAVIVGNGQPLKCKGLEREISLLIQGSKLLEDFNVFLFEGSDVVLGVHGFLNKALYSLIMPQENLNSL